MRTRRRRSFTRHFIVSASLVLFASAVFTGLAGAGGAGLPPGQVPPSAISLPTIAGAAQEGETLTASPGEWSGVSLEFSFQWNRCSSSGASCAPIGGASGTSYRLGAADLGSTLRVSVTAANKRGTSTATSGSSGVVAAAPAPAPAPPPPGPTAPASTAPPQVVGSPKVGQASASSVGTWSGSPTSYAYQWKRCDGSGAGCVSIAGATAGSYTPVSADAGATLRVAVSASNASGTGLAQSTQSSAVAAAAVSSAVGRFGVASGWRLPWLSAADQARYLDSEKAMGAQIVRFDVNWVSIQAGGPTSYNWAPFDAVVHGLNARGMKALGVIAYTPAWARPAGTTDKHPPTNVADYANFCEATARRYAPLGVHNWEIWNEPNITTFFQPKPDVAKYTAMLKACYPRIKAVDPSATVISAGNSPAGRYNAPCGTTACPNINPINFLEGIYANGGGGYFDAVGHHPYSFPNPPSTIADWNPWYQMFGTTPSLRSVMAAHGDSAKKIWATEWGAPTNGPAGSGFVTEAVQASHLTEAYALFGSYPWAGPLFVHDFQDDGTSTSTREHFFGLIRFDWSQKPSYVAYKNAAGAP